MRHDTWHMTHDTWHMTHDTWHMTHDILLNISNLYGDADAGSMTPSRNTRSYKLRSVPSSSGRSFFTFWSSNLLCFFAYVSIFTHLLFICISFAAHSELLRQINPWSIHFQIASTLAQCTSGRWWEKLTQTVKMCLREERRISGGSQWRIRVSPIEGWARVRVRQETFVSRRNTSLLTVWVSHYPQRTPQSEVCMAQQMSLREHRTTLRELVLLHPVGEVWHSHSTALFQFTTHTNALREAFKRKNLKLGFYHNKRRGVLNNFCKAIVVIRSDCCEHLWAIFLKVSSDMYTI